MKYLIYLLVFILLTLIVLALNKNINVILWIKVTLLYLLVFVSYSTDNIHIPIGIIIGYIIVLRFFRNSSIMKLTLLFATIGYFFAMYVIPPIDIENLSYTKDIHQQISRFKEVESVKVFSREELLQKELRTYSDNQVDIDRVMLLTYILTDNNIEITSQKWLLYSAFHELKITGSRKTKGKDHVLLYLSLNGSDYLAMFEHDNNESYLKYVIKGQINNNKKL